MGLGVIPFTLWRKVSSVSRWLRPSCSLGSVPSLASDLHPQLSLRRHFPSGSAPMRLRWLPARQRRRRGGKWIKRTCSVSGLCLSPWTGCNFSDERSLSLSLARDSQARQLPGELSGPWSPLLSAPGPGSLVKAAAEAAGSLVWFCCFSGPGADTAEASMLPLAGRRAFRPGDLCLARRPRLPTACSGS